MFAFSYYLLACTSQIGSTYPGYLVIGQTLICLHLNQHSAGNLGHLIVVSLDRGFDATEINLKIYFTLYLPQGVWLRCKSTKEGADIQSPDHRH